MTEEKKNEVLDRLIAAEERLDQVESNYIIEEIEDDDPETEFCGETITNSFVNASMLPVWKPLLIIVFGLTFTIVGAVYAEKVFLFNAILSLTTFILVIFQFCINYQFWINLRVVQSREHEHHFERVRSKLSFFYFIIVSGTAYFLFGVVIYPVLYCGKQSVTVTAVTVLSNFFRAYMLFLLLVLSFSNYISMNVLLRRWIADIRRLSIRSSTVFFVDEEARLNRQGNHSEMQKTVKSMKFLESCSITLNLLAQATVWVLVFGKIPVEFETFSVFQVFSLCAIMLISAFRVLQYQDLIAKLDFFVGYPSGLRLKFYGYAPSNELLWTPILSLLWAFIRLVI